MNFVFDFNLKFNFSFNRVNMLYSTVLLLKLSK
jgi:hypothetical protein